MLRRSFLALATSTALLGKGDGMAPTGPGSRAYSLSAAPDGTVYLVWIESGQDRHALKLTRLEGGEWAPAKTVATGGQEWFVNFADHPAVSAGPDGRVLVSWSYRPEAARGEKWGLAVRTALSSDRGETWTEAFELGPDNTADYSGFMGFHATSQGFRTAYLAPSLQGEAQRGAPHVKTLRFAEISFAGKVTSDEQLDADVCTCCPLASADTAAGPAVVYRDHRSGEIRDISIVRRVNGEWTTPVPVHRDGWEINGCPANGAAIQAEGRKVATAWFTAAQDQPRVMLARSTDAGASFEAPIRIDAGKPSGWAAVALLQGGRTAVSWLEKRKSEPTVGDVMLRIVSSDGTLSRPRSIARTGSGRSTGIPQMVRSGEHLVLAWRGDDRVRTATAPAL